MAVIKLSRNKLGDKAVLFFSLFFVCLFIVSAASADPGMTAKWYNTGSAAGTYTSLTAAGVEATPWDYELPYRYLEIELSDFDPQKQYEVTVSVATGIQFQSASSWSTPEYSEGVASAVFYPLGNYNGYTNNLTGSVTFTTISGISSITLYAMTEIDMPIWTKLADQYLTPADLSAVNVTLKEASGSNTISELNISSVKAARSYEDKRYSTGIGINTLPLNTASNPGPDNISAFYLDFGALNIPIKFKKLTYEVYAERSDGLRAVYNGDAGSRTYTISDNIATYTINDANMMTYTNRTIANPQLTVSETDGWNIGDYMFLKMRMIAETYTGYEVQLVDTTASGNRYTVINPDFDFLTSIIVTSYGKEMVNSSFYAGTDKIYGVKSYYLQNTSLSDSDPVHIKFEFDTGNAENGYVYSGYTFVPKGQRMKNTEIVLINAAGDTETISYTSSASSNNIVGLYLNANVIAAANGLSGEWYFKQIDYDLDYLPANTILTSTSADPKYAGRFFGKWYGRTVNRITVSDINTGASISRNSVITVTNAEKTLAYISTLSKPEAVVAGNNIALDMTFIAPGNLQSNNCWLKSPVLFIVLPEGVSVKSAASDKGDANVVEYKTVENNGAAYTVYKIEMGTAAAFGPFSSSTAAFRTTADVATDQSRKLEVILATDEDMETQTFALRPLLFFSDEGANGFGSSNGGYVRYYNYDVFDLDNDGSTSDYYMTLSTDFTADDISIISLADAAAAGITTSHKVEFSWEGDTDYMQYRDETIRIALKANGVTADYYDLSAADNWSHTFTLLPAYDSNGAISYTVEETEVPYRYKVTYDTSIAGQTIITNTLQFVDQIVIKRWEDDADREALRPESIYVEIFDDGEETGFIHELSGGGNEWSYTFEHIPYSDNYSVVEKDSCG